jgi:hypothetical protein
MSVTGMTQDSITLKKESVILGKGEIEDSYTFSLPSTIGNEEISNPYISTP